MKKLIIATHNTGKVKEIKKILSNMGFSILSLKDIGYYNEILEDGNTFIENAMKKASTISQELGELTLADDSGLEVNALGGKPGVLSARYAGLDAVDHENNEKLLKDMEIIEKGYRGAQFRCAMVMVIPGANPLISQGICRGQIAFKAKGHNGFGYDPIFIPDGYDKTMAQLSNEIKNSISHRAKALSSLKSEIQKVF